MKTGWSLVLSLVTVPHGPDLVGITVMEKRAGWGTEYPDDIRNGEREYSAFTADLKLNDKANYKSCFHFAISQVRFARASGGIFKNPE